MDLCVCSACGFIYDPGQDGPAHAAFHEGWEQASLIYKQIRSDRELDMARRVAWREIRSPSADHESAVERLIRAHFESSLRDHIRQDRWQNHPTWRAYAAGYVNSAVAQRAPRAWAGFVRRYGRLRLRGLAENDPRWRRPVRAAS